MVESIINVRRSSICWRGRRELITDVRKPEIMVWRHCRRRAIYWLLRSPSQTCHAKPKTQINRRRTLPASFPLVGCLPQAAWPERLLSESQDAVALQQIKERGALPMIDRGDIRQAIDRCSNIWLHCRALVMVSSSIRLTAWLQNSIAGGTVREIDVWAESPRLSPLWLSASSSACHGLLIITVITPLPTVQRQMPENWSWRTRQLLTCRCVSVMLLRSMQNTRELADAKAENDALRDDVAAGRRRLHIKAVCQSVREATTASGGG